MNIFTYEILDTIRRIALQGVQNEFNLSAFFEAKYDDHSGNFVFKYENEVQSWLVLLTGRYIGNRAATVGLPGNPPLPFKDVYLKSNLNHTFWFLPSVASCHAMKNLISKSNNSFYHDYKVIVAAGKDAGVGVKALTPFNEAVRDGITVADFQQLCDFGVFNRRELNSSIFAFKRFEGTILLYASFEKPKVRKIGGFDEIRSSDEFEGVPTEQEN